jgi:hypothetical protein
MIVDSAKKPVSSWENLAPAFRLVNVRGLFWEV